MRVRLLTGIRYRNTWYPARSSLDVPDGLGRSLVDGGAAVEVKAISAPPLDKAVKAPAHNKSAA